MQTFSIYIFPHMLFDNPLSKHIYVHISNLTRNTPLQFMQLIIPSINTQHIIHILLQVRRPMRIPRQNNPRQPTIHPPIKPRLPRIRFIKQALSPIHLQPVFNHKLGGDADPITHGLGNMQHIFQFQGIRMPLLPLLPLLLPVMVFRSPHRLQLHRPNAQNARRPDPARRATVRAERRAVLRVVARAANEHPVPAALVGAVFGFTVPVPVVVVFLAAAAAAAGVAIAVAVVVVGFLGDFVFAMALASRCPLAAFVVADVAVVVSNLAHVCMIIIVVFAWEGGNHRPFDSLLLGKMSHDRR